MRSSGVNVTDKVWPLPALRTVPELGVYAKLPDTEAVALNGVPRSAVPYTMSAGVVQASVVERDVTVKVASPEAGALVPESPAKLAWISLSWTPTLIPVRLTLEIVETPLASVGVPLPKEVDPNLKLIVFPETATPFVVRVALRFTVPPKVPLAGATTRAVLVAFTFRLTVLLTLDPRPTAA